MPDVRMHVTGRAVGATDEQDGFAEMVRTIVREAAADDPAQVQVRIGADDAAAIEIRVDRRRQQAIGEALERLLAEPQITSTVVGEEPEAAEASG
jgi:hypothetical protein